MQLPLCKFRRLAVFQTIIINYKSTLLVTESLQHELSAAACLHGCLVLVSVHHRAHFLFYHGFEFVCVL